MSGNLVTQFKVDECYTNDQIRYALSVENLGGIRPSLDSQKNLRHVAILTAAEDSGRMLHENPYRDRIENDVLIYTAQGRAGDQQLTGRNKRLPEQYTIPTPFFGFINLGRQTYRFLGLLELLRHYQEHQVDKRGSVRKVWVFELRIHRHPDVVPIDQAAAISAALLGESRRQNLVSELEREVAELPDIGQASAENLTLFEAETVRGRLITVDPYKFEHLIKGLMERNGFTSVSVTSASGDGGIDINAYVDSIHDFFAGTHVQAQVKRWRHAIGSVEINKFRGALSTTAKKVFITTSHYTRAAVMEANHKSKLGVTLIDSAKLASIITRSGIDVDAYLH